MGALDVIVLEKEALRKEPNVAMSGVEYGTIISIGEGLLKVKVFGFIFHIHPPSDENFTVTTSYSSINLLQSL